MTQSLRLAFQRLGIISNAGHLLTSPAVTGRGEER